MLWKPKSQYGGHNTPTFIHSLIHINPLYALQTDCSKIHFNIKITSMPKSSKWSLSCRFPHQNSVTFFIFYLLPENTKLHHKQCVEVSKIFRTDAVKIVKLTIRPIGHHLLHIWNASWKSFSVRVSSTHCDSAWIS
jgi:hypothetical protein